MANNETQVKKWYRSKELWLALVGVYNFGLAQTLGMPHLDPSPELITAWIGMIGAVRAFFTKTKLKI